MISGVRPLLPLVLVASSATAPLQCAREPKPEQRLEEEPAEVLYGLAEKFKKEDDKRAQIETLRFIVARYPTSRYAERAKLDLKELSAP